jgi:arylsulfatase A-like enzyme
MFPMIAKDTAKAQAANMLELDYGVGNVTAALAAAGYWNNTVVIFVSGMVLPV